MGRAGSRYAETGLMRRVVERLAEASAAEAGLAGVAPQLARFLKADLGVFLVRKGGVWLTACHGGDDALLRSLPRTPSLASRSGYVRLSDIVRRDAPGGNAAEAPSRDSVIVPVRAGRRSLGYGVFRTGSDRLPSPGTLRLLDAVGAQVAAFCECVSRGERKDPGRESVDRLLRSNRDLGWLLGFSESLHSHSDPDSMFKWLGREMGTFLPIVGLELVSLPGGPVVRVGFDAATRVSARKDGAAVAGEWSGILSSRYRIHVPAGDFRLKRFPCLPVGGNWEPAAGAPGVRKIECPLYHAGQVLGVFVAYLPAWSPDGPRAEWLVESVAGQVALFLHKHADRERMSFLANHDALTGLLNHLSFQNIFEREFERHRRHERNMSLLFLDIDHFKRINDEYGHQVGDRILREVGNVLTANLRKIDYVFRYGGDEFVVLMTETDSVRASMLAERVLAAVKRDVGRISPSGLPVSVSIGVADCGALTQAEREELLLRADGALYEAKNSGRGRVRVAAAPVGCAVGVN